jgi:ribosome-binding factor A
MPREFSRTLRINAQLQRELSALIRGELTDPRVARVSVTQVSVAPDMRNARVAVSLLGTASLLRRALGKSLKLRYVPALSFVADEALREGDRIGSLIRDATARDRVQPALKDDEAGAPPPDDGKQ